MHVVVLSFALALALVTPGSATAQERPVSLAEAIEQAGTLSPDVLAAQARARAADEGSRAAGAYRWPSVGLDAGAIRSDDPVAAFGGRLRQGRFTQQDFDPTVLNHPAALTDWSGGVAVGWTPVDFSADAGYRAARADAEAAGLGSQWAVRAAVFRVEARYVEAVAAERRLEATAAAVQAAEANARRADQRLAQGVLTEADVLQAQAALQSTRAERIDVARALADARDRLAMAMGWPEGQVPVPTDSVFVVDSVPAHVDLAARPDLMASEVAVRAAEARVQQASRARLPRVEGFYRLETHGAQAFSGTQDDWTVGFRIAVPVFTGFRIGALQRAASAQRVAAQHDHQQRLREAEADVAAARRGLEAAGQGSAAAEAGAAAAQEAARLMRRRFEEGLVTTADLLSAEAQAADLRTRAVNARLGLHMAAARLAFLTDTTTENLSEGLNR